MIYLVRVWPNPIVANEVIEQRLNNEQDWIRFDDMTWLVQSNLPANTLSHRLRPVIGAQGLHLVIEVDRHNAQGGMTGMFWEWINNHA